MRNAVALFQPLSLALLSLTLLLPGCGGTETATDPDADPGADAAPAPAPAADDRPLFRPETDPEEDMVAAMQENIAHFETAPELDPGKIKVEHVLVAFAGAQNAKVERSQEAAEELAAKAYKEALAGADWKTLRQRYSTDPGGGIYDLEKSSGFVKGFKHVSFRLRVGEIGIAPYHKIDTPHGYHIIKRLQ